MGENILESQAKNTEKRRARHAADQRQGRLFGRGDRVADEFTVDCRMDSTSIKPGDILRCFPGKGAAPIDVVHENMPIGVVEEGGGEVLRDIVQQTGCQTVVVRSVCEITDTAKVQVEPD